jgi:hypothetical protein
MRLPGPDARWPAEANSITDIVACADELLPDSALKHSEQRAITDIFGDMNTV